MRLGMVSAYPPRRCATATFAADLGRALAPEFDPVVCALDRYTLTYPREVAAVIREDEQDDFVRAARVLAEHAVDVVLLHFDGPGPYLPGLAGELRRLNLPYVVAVHRVPGTDRTAAAVAAGAERVLVFTDAERDRARAQLGVDADAVDVVPLPVPTVIWHSRRASGRRGMRERAATRPRPAVTDLLTGLGEGPVLATFGPGRDLESALAALPAIRQAHPGARLVVVGADAAAGDAVVPLDLQLTSVEMSALLARTDVVVAPALPEDRSWSATLTAAVAAGCAVVARRHRYAEELLASGAGVIVEARDPAALADAVTRCLAPEALPHMRAAALSRGRRLTWPAVTNRYARILRAAAARQTVWVAPSTSELRLDRVEVPGPHDTERWARLAVAGAALAAWSRSTGPIPRGRRIVSYVDRAATALAAAAGVPGHGDAAGWALWGLGSVASEPAMAPTVRRRARELRDMVAALTLNPPGGRACVVDACAVLGLAAEPDLAGVCAEALRRCAARLDQAWRGPVWPWFGDRLGDDGGARLPQALIVAGRRLGDDGMVRRGLTSLEWYARRCGLTTGGGVLRLPTAGVERAADAGALVEALVDAYAADRSAHIARLARTAFAWFHGGNRWARPVFDPELGVAGSALVADGTPSGDGTLEYLAALLRLIGAGLVRPVGADAGHHLAPA